MSEGDAEWFIHRFECPNCDAITRADRAVNCFRCGSEMKHAEEIATIDVAESDRNDE